MTMEITTSPYGIVTLRYEVDGEEYRVIWRQHEGFCGDDESDADDWENPARIDAI